jgi:hypothetical protein
MDDKYRIAWLTAHSREIGKLAFEAGRDSYPPADVDGDAFVAGWLTARDEYEQRQFAV